MTVLHTYTYFRLQSLELHRQLFGNEMVLLQGVELEPLV